MAINCNRLPLDVPIGCGPSFRRTIPSDTPGWHQLSYLKGQSQVEVPFTSAMVPAGARSAWNGLWFAPAARTQAEKHLSIYAPAASYSVPLTPYDAKDYIGLADVLEPLGTVEAHEDGGKWKLRFNPAAGHEVQAEFHDGKNKGKVHGQDFELSGDFHIANGRGYLPMHDIGTLVPLFTGSTADFRESSLRLLLGNVAIKFTQDLQKTPPRLILSFSAPVNPMVASEPGKLRLIFRREPLVNTGSETVQTSDPNITSLNFSDASGVAQIAVNGSVPLTATFSDGNKTIVIAPAPAAPEAAKPTTPAPAQAAAPAPVAPTPAAPAAPHFLVVIDPAHGGDERGAAITDSLNEKDVNLAFARRLQHELQNKGVYASLLRYGDATIALDDRAVAVNSLRPAVYVCVHAANLGTGTRVFTALMAPTGAGTRGFLPWPQAQAPFLDLSSQVAGSVSAELSTRHIPVTALPAPLRPMRNIAAPAIALEIAPPDGDVDNINDADYQQSIVAAVANGIVAMRPKLMGAAR